MDTHGEITHVATFTDYTVQNYYKICTEISYDGANKQEAELSLG